MTKPKRSLIPRDLSRWTEPPDYPEVSPDTWAEEFIRADDRNKAERED